MSNSYRFTIHRIVQGESEAEARINLKSVLSSEAELISKSATSETRQIRDSSLLVESESSAKSNRNRQTVVYPKMSTLLKSERQETIPVQKKPKQIATWDPVNKKMVFSY